MYPHRIRLRGPWECELIVPLGQDTEHGSVRRVNMPCRPSEMGLKRSDAPILCRRRFGYPGRIDAHERVWLTFSGAKGLRAVRLNGLQLGKAADVESDITGLLKDRNVLEIDLHPSSDVLPWEEVALEIRCLPDPSSS